MKTQSTYLLPNAGGFESFVGGLPEDGRGTPPDPVQSPAERSPADDAASSGSFELTGSSEDKKEGSERNSTSDYFSPISDSSNFPPVNPEYEEPPMSEEEKRLTEPVQDLLDKMNSASSRLNVCEHEIHQFEAQRHQIAQEWRDKKLALLDEIGQATIDRAKPMFEAYEEQLQLQFNVNEAAELYHQAVIECTEMKAVLQTAHENGSNDDHLGHLLELLVSSQTKRETFERLSQDRTQEFQLAQKKCEDLRKAIGLRTVERAWPWFSGFLQSKGLSEECSANIQILKKEMSMLREQYRHVMHALEEISSKVHILRKTSLS